MQTWIFQGNPDQFDIDGYLATWPSEFTWSVTRYGNEIQVGDRVFLWRNQGKQKAVAGIIAEATVVGGVEPRLEPPEEQRFWHDTENRGTQTYPCALLRLTRLATRKEALRREWLEDDPVLRDLPNLKMAAGTNYRIPRKQVLRLIALWNRTGQDWSRDEALAGLWAYGQTYHGPVSRLSGSPVATVAMLIGRPITGVYNKVMNFRALDPRDSRAGLSANSAMDERVWGEFFDIATGQLDLAALDQEFKRLWQEPTLLANQATPSAPTREAVEATAQRLDGEPLEVLLVRYLARRRTRPTRPSLSVSVTRDFDRDPHVIAIARKRARYQCEIPDCAHPTFLTADELPYSEVHHIQPLADGGDDTIENVACLCPAHHREAHLGKNREQLAQKLLAIRGKSTYAKAVHSPAAE